MWVMNGKRVGREVRTPYYNNYREEVQYLTFDVTNQIRKKTKLQICLGNGWYKGTFIRAGQTNNFGSEYKLIAELHIQYK